MPNNSMKANEPKPGSSQADQGNQSAIDAAVEEALAKQRQEFEHRFRTLEEMLLERPEPRNHEPATIARIESERERHERRTAEGLDRIEAQRRANEENLLAGDHRFEVSLTGEPRMTKVVGGRDALEAEAKYKQYFGIRAIQDHQKSISVTSLNGQAEPALA